MKRFILLLMLLSINAFSLEKSFLIKILKDHSISKINVSEIKENELLVKGISSSHKDYLKLLKKLRDDGHKIIPVKRKLRNTTEVQTLFRIKLKN